MFLLFPPLIALVGSALIPFLRKRIVRNLWTESVTLASAICAFFLAFQGGSSAMLTLFSVAPGLSVAFRLDGTGRVFFLLVSFLWPLASLYAFEYMTYEQREARFFTFYTLSFGVTQLLALSANLFTLYLFYECLTLITLPLVTHHDDRDSLSAGMTYLKFNIGGAALGLVGLITLCHFGACGPFTPGGLLSAEGIAVQEDLLRALFLVAFLGFSAKAALFPLSVWLPRVSVAPTPVTALLHAVAVVNAGAFAVLRLIYDCFGVALLAGSWAREAALMLSAFTVLFGAVMAVREHHLKRRLAWSTVSNLSYMLFSACLMTPAGHTGALTHLVFHGLIKITLFYCAGAFMIRCGKEYLEELRGLRRRMPFTVAVFTLAGIALTGIPPLPGFISKWKILNAAVAVASPGAWAGTVALILSSVLAAVYLLSPAVQMIFSPSVHHASGNTAVPGSGETASPAHASGEIASSGSDETAGAPAHHRSHHRRDPGVPITVVLVILSLLMLYFGVASSSFMDFLSTVSAVY